MSEDEVVLAAVGIFVLWCFVHKKEIAITPPAAGRFGGDGSAAGSTNVAQIDADAMADARCVCGG